MDIYENVASGVNGTATSTLSLTADTVHSHSFASDNQWIFFSSSVNMVMSVEESDRDRHLMTPANTSVYRRRNHHERTVINTVPSTNTTYLASDSNPVVTVEIGDGAGSDSTQGMAAPQMNTDYAFGTELSDFHIVSPNTVDIEVYYYHNGSWTLAETISLTGTAGSPDHAFREGNSGFGVAGNIADDSGAAAYFQSGGTDIKLWWFKGDNPFMITVNDTSNDEEILVGFSEASSPVTVDPSVTPTPTVTPTITPSVSVTPSITPSITVTPTVTPSTGATQPITFVADTTGEAVSGGTITLSGIQSGDVVIANLTSAFTAAGLSSGWTNVRNKNSDVYQRVAYIVSTGTSVTYTVPSGDYNAVILTAFRNVDNTTPLDVTRTTINRNSNQTNITPADITTVTNGCMIVTLMGVGGDRTTSLTGPSGYTNSEIFEGGGFFGLTSTAAIDYKLQSTAGTESPGSYNWTTGEYSTCTTIALRPG